jgi:hypothetical protein
VKRLGPSPAQRQTAAREAALPDVRELAKKHGIKTIAWCLGKIRNHEKKLKELSRIQAEAAKLERELGVKA